MGGGFNNLDTGRINPLTPLTPFYGIALSSIDPRKYAGYNILYMQNSSYFASTQIDQMHKYLFLNYMTSL